VKAWRVGVRDGHVGRDAGFAVALASTVEEAQAALVHYQQNDTAFGKLYEVSRVDAHETHGPYVVFTNWGEWDEWPPGSGPHAACHCFSSRQSTSQSSSLR
jgi:hypothetical protein